MYWDVLTINPTKRNRLLQIMSYITISHDWSKYIYVRVFRIKLTVYEYNLIIFN